MAAWFHVNGMPVFARSKAEAVEAFKAGRLIKIHDRTIEEISMKRETPYGTATDNPDGSIDVTLDPQKSHASVVEQHKQVLADIRRAKGSNIVPDAVLDDLERIAEDELKKVQARPPATVQTTTFRVKR